MKAFILIEMEVWELVGDIVEILIVKRDDAKAVGEVELSSCGIETDGSCTEVLRAASETLILTARVPAEDDDVEIAAIAAKHLRLVNYSKQGMLRPPLHESV